MNIASCWVSHPHEWQPLFRKWHASNETRTELHAWPQYGEQAVVGLTLRPHGAVERCGFRLLVTVPHGHEPAPTAAIVDAVAQLLTGAHLDGTETALPCEEIHDRALITFLPDTNSQGRARSPQRCWDGIAYDNDAFLKVAFGVASDGARFGRYPEWRISEHRPQRVGIVYEQLTEDQVVEPNTSRASTHSRAVDALFDRYRYTHMLDMHQHEGDEAALLPADFEELPAADREATEGWAARLIVAWQTAGASPRPTPSIPYRGQPRQQFFREFWAGRCPGMLRLVSEVRNNRHVRTGEPTPMAHQFRMAAAALDATLYLALEGARS